MACKYQKYRQENYCVYYGFILKVHTLKETEKERDREKWIYTDC